MTSLMNLEQYFGEIHSFLSSYQRLIGEEILNFYPNSLESYKSSWIEAILSLNEKELLAVDNGEDSSLIKDRELKDIFTQIDRLYRQMEPRIYNKAADLPPRSYMGVKEKKKHEIDTLRSFIPQICSEHKLTKIVDIGGGVGHLSRILTHHHFISTVSIDQNSSLQIVGLKRAKRYPIPSTKSKLTFVNATLGTDQELPLERENHLLLGLHTCGPLANNLIDEAIKNKTCKAVLSFGCCYLKLNGKSDINLSSVAKKLKGLELSKYALTLATRSHAGLSTQEFRNKRRVKNYRYSLHLLMYKKLGIRQFLGTDNVSLKLYNGAFENYATEMLVRMEIKHSLSQDEIKLFYNDKETKAELAKLFAATVIRWQFGKIIELYILIDRSLYLKENGMEVQINSYFNPLISPRNIGIFGYRRNSKS